MVGGEILLLLLEILVIDQKTFDINTFIFVVHFRLEVGNNISFKYLSHYRVPLGVKELETERW